MIAPTVKVQRHEEKSLPRSTIPDDQLPQLMETLEGSDSVELKVTVPDDDIRSVADALGLDFLDAQIRQVVFFDTPDLALNRAGVVVRARRIQGGRGDTVVKLRPIAPADLPEEVCGAGGLGIEVDAVPGGFVCSASMKRKAKAAEVRRVVLGEESIRSLFSKKQKAFFKAHAPDGIGLDDLAILGPINILKLKFEPDDFGRKAVAELWIYPDGSRVLELSTRCLHGEAFRTAAETRSYLTGKGVDLEDVQQTKTKAALEYFAALRRTARRGPGMRAEARA